MKHEVFSVLITFFVAHWSNRSNTQVCQQMPFHIKHLVDLAGKLIVTMETATYVLFSGFSSCHIAHLPLEGFLLL